MLGSVACTLVSPLTPIQFLIISTAVPTFYPPNKPKTVMALNRNQLIIEDDTIRPQDSASQCDSSTCTLSSRAQRAAKHAKLRKKEAFLKEKTCPGTESPKEEKQNRGMRTKNGARDGGVRGEG